MNTYLASILSSAFVLLMTSALFADIKLPFIISDNMVLQQGMPIPIWGESDPGEKITIHFAGQTKSADADANGKWLIHLDPLEALPNQQPRSMTITAGTTLELNNILVGEVWICSGQSNMVWPLAEIADKKILDGISEPDIRLFNVKSLNAAYDDPTKESFAGQWQTCTGDTVAGFSAVAYFFGLDLHKALNVPIALISNPVGGTPAEAWLSRKAIEADPQLKGILDRCDQYMTHEYSKAKEHYEKALADWPQEAEKAKARGEVPPYKPYVPFSPQNACWPSNLYNTRVAPLVPFGIRGVIWYQGESNIGNRFASEQLCDRLFPAVINDWRRNWHEGDFPFYYVQIAPYRYKGVAKELCAIVREAQAKTLSLPNTAMAGTMDIGEPNNIHPRNKWDVGKRLALCALARTYGKDIVYSGPTYKSMSIETDKIRLHFSHTGSGLLLKGDALTFFQIAGPDKHFVDAAAVIDGDTVVVSSDQVPNPVAVRYGWRDDALLNLFNKENLPAFPFRTDDWPAIPAEEK